MKIVFGNQKGGVGKSTLCVMLANYLTLIKKKDVLIMDMDFQKTIEEHRQGDNALFNNEMPYEILPIETTDYLHYAQQIENDGTIVIIDLPGRLDDDSLIPILKDADFVICPFQYEKYAFGSTLTFAEIVKHFDPDKRIFFVPNKFNNSVSYGELKSKADATLSVLGSVTKPISQRVTLTRINTYQITEEQKKIVEDVFDFIYTKIN
jgi:chromosome partitioning protein